MSEINDEDLYDEFGNYIGPELDSSSDESDDESLEKSIPDESSDVSVEATEENMIVTTTDDGNSEGVTNPINAIVLHEDKDHYPSATETFGDDVNAAVLDEDAMDLDKPIVEPVATKTYHADETHSTFEFNYSDKFLSGIVGNETTRTRRCIAVVGHLHHGKTSLVDCLIESTLQEGWGQKASLEDQGPRFTDTLKSEQERQMSLVSTPVTLLLNDTRGKSFGVTLLDCPGHTQFHDESVASLRVADGAILVVDAVEGVMIHTEMLIKQIVAEGLPILLCISKLDRVLTELQLPPRDAYYKLLQIIDSVNVLLKEASLGRYPPLCPTKGNVAFGSALHGWFFTLNSMAQLYAEQQGGEKASNQCTLDQFAKRLWGNEFWDPQTSTFHKSPSECVSRVVDRSFVSFCLNPIYKIYAACLGESEQDTKKQLRKLGVLLTKEELRSSARPLLRTAMRCFMETATSGLVDMISQHVPSPSTAARAKIARCYTGPMDSVVCQSMISCDPKGRLVINSCKLYPRQDGNSFDVFGRIYSGSVRPGQRVMVLGEGYLPGEDDEDMAIASVEAVLIPRGRLMTNVTVATAGNWVLLQGVDSTISKTATIIGLENAGVDDFNEEPVHIFKPLSFPQAGRESVVKLALEPLNPAELPKMVEGLRRVSKAYPMARTRVEESGEHVVFGTGELYLDCILADLRHFYADVEVKVADPVVAFRETVVETSSLKCFDETTNKRNKLTLISEPLDEGLSEELEKGRVKLNSWDSRKVGKFFQSKFGWDLLSSRSVWAFGDSAAQGTNILLDDTLPSEVDKQLLNTCKSSIVQGFQWATREGPLCEEPVRGVKVKILDSILADKAIHRGGGQIIPTTRRIVHSSILTATPRLMEPIYRLQIQCPGEIVTSIHSLLKRRRGNAVQEKPIGGTLLYNVKGFIPVLDSFGFETDLRTFTQGQAMVHSVFDHWDIVPGDPLDKTVVLQPLEPSQPRQLARELLLKTRRRKGLSEDVSIDNFFNDSMRDYMNSGLGTVETKSAI